MNKIAARISAVVVNFEAVVMGFHIVTDICCSKVTHLLYCS